MDPSFNTGARHRQPPRPPVRPFPNPTPQREGLVKRLPTWSSRRAIPHTVPDAESGVAQVYTERPPDLTPEQVPGGMFGKIVASEEPIEGQFPFHYDIPPPMPYTNCPKQYISGNITRKLPLAKGPLKAPNAFPTTFSTSIPSSAPRPGLVSVPVQTRPAPPPPPPRSAGIGSVPSRQAPPSRPAPSLPSRPPPPSPTPAAAPVVRRRRAPPAAGVRPPPSPPSYVRPPQSPSPITTSHLAAQPVQSDHPLFRGQAAAAPNPDVERAIWFRNKLSTDLEEASVNNPDRYSEIYETMKQLDKYMEELSLASTDDEYSKIISALEVFPDSHSYIGQ